MHKVQVGILGTGFMGQVHVEALRRLPYVNVAALAGRTLEASSRFAQQQGIDFTTTALPELLERVDVVHVCTPNNLHFEQTMATLHAGKHVVCEKPLASTIVEAEQMIELATQKNLHNATVYNIRAYPQVQQMRQMCATGQLGTILTVQGTYSQDWLSRDTDWNWRINAGESRTFADIGTHWCDLAEHILGRRIASLCADLTTFYPERKKPTESVETFARTDASQAYESVAVTTEDFGSMLFHLEGGARGAMTVSQVASGRKNRLMIEVTGTRGSVCWEAESPDQLWIGRRETPNQLIVKDPLLLDAGARNFADLPGGHSEGYDDSFKQTFRRFYDALSGTDKVTNYPTFVDGLRQMQILSTVLESSRERSWVDVNQ